MCVIQYIPTSRIVLSFDISKYNHNIISWCFLRVWSGRNVTSCKYQGELLFFGNGWNHPVVLQWNAQWTNNRHLYLVPGLMGEVGLSEPLHRREEDFRALKDAGCRTVIRTRRLPLPSGKRLHSASLTGHSCVTQTKVEETSEHRSSNCDWEKQQEVISVKVSGLKCTELACSTFSSLYISSSSSFHRWSEADTYWNWLELGPSHKHKHSLVAWESIILKINMI